MGKILDRETSDDILNSLIPLIADMIPDYGSVIRTDNAPQFQKLAAIGDDPESYRCKEYNCIDSVFVNSCSLLTAWCQL